MRLRLAKLFSLILIIVCILYKCKKSFKVGVIGPMNTQNGKLLWNSVELAAKEINEQGGILDRNIELIKINDHNNVEKATHNLKKSIKELHPDILLGGMSSGVVLKLMDIMANHKILWLGTGGAHPNVIKKIQNNYQNYKYYFRVGTTDANQQAKAIGQFAIDVLTPKYGYKKFAIIGTKLKWAKFALGESKKMLLKRGYKLVYEHYFNPKTTQFEHLFKNAVKNNAQFIMSYTLGAEGTLFIQQYHDLKVAIPNIGNHAIGVRDEWWQETGGKCIYNSHFRFSGGKAAYTEKTLDFYHKFKKEFKNSPGFLSWPGYDALYILKEVTQKNKSFQINQIISQLEKIEYVGNVRYKFTKNHDLTYGIKNGKRYIVPVYFQWKKDGQLRPIWPPGIAGSNFQIPHWIEK